MSLALNPVGKILRPQLKFVVVLLQLFCFRFVDCTMCCTVIRSWHWYLSTVIKTWRNILIVVMEKSIQMLWRLGTFLASELIRKVSQVKERKRNFKHLIKVNLMFSFLVFHVPAASRSCILPQPQCSAPGPETTELAHQQGDWFDNPVRFLAFWSSLCVTFWSVRESCDWTL